jgi:hypothetical protein
MSKSIFNIQQEYINLLNQLEEAEGELTPELEQALAITEQELEVKSVGYSHVIRKTESDIDVIAAEIKRLQALKKSKENTIERLKSSVENAMVMFGIESISTATTVLSLRKSESVEITDESLLPKKYIAEKVTYSPDKNSIKSAIKAGENVPGASLKTNQNLQVK